LKLTEIKYIVKTVQMMIKLGEEDYLHRNNGIQS